MRRPLTAEIGGRIYTIGGGDGKPSAFVHTSRQAHPLGLYKVANDDKGHVAQAEAVSKADITALGIPAQDTTYDVATSSANGLMPKEAVSKLAAIAPGANDYTHPTSSGNKHIPSGGAEGNVLCWGSDGTAVWGAGQTATATYDVATATSDGLMPKEDKAKLDGVAPQANKYVHPTSGVTAGEYGHNPMAGYGQRNYYTIPHITLDENGHVVSAEDRDMPYPMVFQPPLAIQGGLQSPAYSGLVPAPTAQATAVHSSYTAGVDCSLEAYLGERGWTHIDVATTTAAGMMSPSDKSKLNGIAVGENNYVLPTASASTLGGVKVGSRLSISSGVLSVNIPNATQSVSGLMSYTDKAKLDGMSSSGESAVQSTLLWSGSWSSGSITVPNTSWYPLFIAYADNSYVPLICVNPNGDRIYGTGTKWVESGNIRILAFEATVSGSTWTMVLVRYNSSLTTQRNVTKIWGLR